MPLRLVYFSTGLAFVTVSSAAEETASAIATSPSPIRQLLRETIKVKVRSTLPAASTVKPDVEKKSETTSDDKPVLLPAVVVIDRTLVRTVDGVDAAQAQLQRLSSPALIKTRRAELLFPPVMDDLPMRQGDGSGRLKLDILKLRF